MSQWTHIRGGLELNSSPFEQKKFGHPEPEEKDFENREAFLEAHEEWRKLYLKSLYLPFPEEQFKLSAPGLRVRYGDKKEDGTRESFKTLNFRAAIFSLPRAKKYIKEAFDLLPQGESGFRYSLDQNRNDSRSSGSGFFIPCLNKYYQQAINKMYYSEDPWHSYDYDQLREYFKIDDDCSVDDVDYILVGVRSDLRYCSGEELMEGLEKCFLHLRKHRIAIEDGYLEWQDEYEPKVIYSWRRSRIGDIDEVYSFYKLDRTTNQIIYSKTYKYKKDEHGYNDYDNPELDIEEHHYPLLQEE